MSNKLYNTTTWIWHQVLRAPIRFKTAYDNKTRRPQLTVVFLHGICATSDTWKTTIRQLTNDEDFVKVRLVALDLLGFGKSLRADWPKYDEITYSRALHKSLRRLKTRGKLILVGHSMGSLIAANYIVNYSHPVEVCKLILVSAPVLMANEQAKLPDQIYTKSYYSLHEIVNGVPAAEVFAKIAQKFTSFQSAYMNTTATHRSMDNIILNPHNYQTFVKIHIPTLLVHGHFDPLVIGNNLKRIAEHNPHYVKYTSVIGQHDISAGKRAKIVKEIKQTLKEQAKYEIL